MRLEAQKSAATLAGQGITQVIDAATGKAISVAPVANTGIVNAALMIAAQQGLISQDVAALAAAAILGGTATPAGMFVKAVEIPKGSPNTITMSIPGMGLFGTVKVLHQKAAGTFEILNAIIVGDVIQITSLNGWSPIVIIGASANAYALSPKTGQQASVAVILAIACLGGVLAFSRKAAKSK